MHPLALTRLRRWLDPGGEIAKANPGYHVYFALDGGRLAVPPRDGLAFATAVIELVAGRRPIPLCLAEAFDPRLFCLFFDIDWKVGDPNIDPGTGQPVTIKTVNPYAYINGSIKDLCRRIYRAVNDAVSGLCIKPTEPPGFQEIEALVFTNTWTGSKAGAHMVFPGFLVDVATALKIRWFVVQHMKETYPYANDHELDYEEMIDEMVYTHGKSLRLPHMHKATGREISSAGKVYRFAQYYPRYGDPRTGDWFRGNLLRQLMYGMVFPFNLDVPSEESDRLKRTAALSRSFWAFMGRTRRIQPPHVRDGPSTRNSHTGANNPVDMSDAMVADLEKLHPSLTGNIKRPCKVLIKDGTS